MAPPRAERLPAVFGGIITAILWIVFIVAVWSFLAHGMIFHYK